MGDSLFFRNKHYAKGTIAKIRYCNQVFVATYKGKINATYAFILDNGKEVWIKYKDILSIEVCQNYIPVKETPKDIDINKLVIGWIWYILIINLPHPMPAAWTAGSHGPRKPPQLCR